MIKESTCRYCKKYIFKLSDEHGWWVLKGKLDDWSVYQCKGFLDSGSFNVHIPMTNLDYLEWCYDRRRTTHI